MLSQPSFRRKSSRRKLVNDRQLALEARIAGPLWSSVGVGSFIFELGSMFCRCGVAGEEVVRCVIPTPPELSRLMHNTHDASPELLAGLSMLIERLLCEGAFLPGSRTPVLLLDIFPNPIVQKLVTQLLRGMTSSKLVHALSLHAVLLPFVDLNSAVVVDVGFYATRAVPVCCDIPIAAAARRTNGMQHVHNVLRAQMEDVLRQHRITPEAVTDAMLQEFLRKYGTIAPPRGHNLRTVVLEKKYPLSVKTITVVLTPNEALETLFETSKDEADEEVHESVVTTWKKSIESCRGNFDFERSRVQGNVILCGGGCFVRNFSTRFAYEVLQKYECEPSILSFSNLEGASNFSSPMGGSTLVAMHFIAA